SGTVRGPILAPYDYKTASGARAAKILWKDSVGFEKDDEFLIFYNGGGYFVHASENKNTTILATYNTKENLAAIVECKVGKGTAILSGVHFEYNPNFFGSEDPYLEKIKPELQKGNLNRMKLLKHLLGRLNIKFN